jgi:hypothetical protein
MEKEDIEEKLDQQLKRQEELNKEVNNLEKGRPKNYYDLRNELTAELQGCNEMIKYYRNLLEETQHLGR